MAAQVGEVFVKLTLDDKEFESGLNKVENKTQKTGGFLSNAFAFATGGLITKGIEAVTSSFGKLWDGMIGGNAAFEKYQTQFSVLLGSTDAAKQRLDELAKFGATTPFELDELVKADKVLTAFGIHSEKTMTMVGDSAAAAGVKYEDMALIYGKLSTGSGEAVARIVELGLATREEMESWGVKFSKSGQMLGDTAENYEKITNGIAKKNGGMMAAQSKTFEGMISNLQDWISQTLRLLGAPIFEVLKDKLGVVLEFLNSPQTQAALNNFAQMLASGIGVAMDWLSNTAIPALINAWNNLQPTIQFVLNLFNLFSNALNGSNTSMLGMQAAIIGTLGPFGDFGIAIADAVVWLGTNISAAAQFATQLFNLFTAALNGGSTSMLSVQAALIGVLQPFGDFGVVLTDVVLWLGTNIPKAVQTATDVWNNALLPALQTIWTFIQNNIQPIFAGLVVALLSVVVPAFIAWATAAVSAATATVAALLPVVAPLVAIGAAVFLLYKAWDSNFLGIRTALTDFWNNYGLPIFETLKAWLEVNLPIAIQAVTDFWNNILLPALQAVWSFISTYVIPIIIEIIQVYFAALQIALQSLANFWNTVLLPAINAVWSFLTTYIIPLIAALINVHLALFEVAIKKVTDTWNIMKGAFLAAWDFIQGFLMPAIKLLTNAALGPLSEMAKSAGNTFNNVLKPALTTISNFVSATVSPAFDSLRSAISSVSGAISGIGDAISKAISWLNKLADKIRSMPSMPSGIPGFASGTNFAPGGLAMVGERGPELVNLPRGSQVFTAAQTRDMLANGGNSNTTNYYVNYNTTQTSAGFANDVSLLRAMTKGV